jgi:hypothetical protein
MGSPNAWIPSPGNSLPEGYGTSEPWDKLPRNLEEAVNMSTGQSCQFSVSFGRTPMGGWLASGERPVNPRAMARFLASRARKGRCRADDHCQTALERSAFSVGYHVFVVGHRVHIPTRFVNVRP